MPLVTPNFCKFYYAPPGDPWSWVELQTAKPANYTTDVKESLRMDNGNPNVKREVIIEAEFTDL